MGRTPVRQGSDAGEELVLALVREHAGSLLRFARRFSICADDAQDAYQRTLEKLVRRVRTEPPENAVNWARTVLRNEALAIRAEREQTIGRLALEDERHRDSATLDPAERVERFERLAHTAEALRGLKPQEMTALALRAEGLSYKEICARTGWTYTRCNRAISEGRRALLERLRAIESGAECGRWMPLLSLLADGEATVRELAELRPHLRSCPACRATLRGFHDAPHQVAALLPVAGLPAVAVATGAVGSGAGSFGLVRHLEAALQNLAERANTTVLRFHGAIDALPSTKLAAVAASTVAVAGGGAAIEQAASRGTPAAGAAPAAVASAGTDTSTSGAIPIAAPTPRASGTPVRPASTTAGTSTSTTAATTASATTSAPIAEFALEPLATGGSTLATAASIEPFAPGGSALGTAAGVGPSGNGGSAFATADGAAAAGSPTSTSSASAATGSAAATADADGDPAGTPSASPAPSGERARRERPGRSTTPPSKPADPASTTSASPPRPEFTAAAQPPAPTAPAPSSPAANPQPAAPSGPEFAGP